MTEDDIKRIAKEAGLAVGTNISGIELVGSPGNGELKLLHMTVDELKLFAELIAQHEREECAKVCDILQDQYLALDDRYGAENSELYYGKSCGAADCVEAIRVKG